MQSIKLSQSRLFMAYIMLGFAGAAAAWEAFNQPDSLERVDRETLKQVTGKNPAYSPASGACKCELAFEDRVHEIVAACNCNEFTEDYICFSCSEGSYYMSGYQPNPGPGTGTVMPSGGENVGCAAADGVRRRGICDENGVCTSGVVQMIGCTIGTYPPFVDETIGFAVERRGVQLFGMLTKN